MTGRLGVATFAFCVSLLLHAPERGYSEPTRSRRQFAVDGPWDNFYDRDIDFSCGDLDQAISGLSSRHSDEYEDRQFKFECSDLPITFEDQISLWTSGYQNWFDEDIDFRCPFGSVMRGVGSYHSNSHEDRRWRFTCTQVRGFCLSECVQSDYNDFDAEINIPTLEGFFITGAKSHHHSRYEDRQWSYTRCRLGPC